MCLYGRIYAWVYIGFIQPLGEWLNWHEVFGSPHGDEHMTNMTQGSKRAFARKVKGNMRSPIG